MENINKYEKVKFPSLTNYKQAYSLVKVFALVIVLFFGCIAAFVSYNATQTVKNLQNSIYVLSPTGEISIALRSNEKDNRYFEYESHIEKGYTLWYEMDEGSYHPNIEKALFLFGDCGKLMLNDYKEQKMLRNLQAKNMQLKVSVDSIKWDKTVTPVFGVVYGVQTIKRPGGQLKRRMDCSFNILDYSRSKQNPHGVKIENWNVINSEVIVLNK